MLRTSADCECTEVVAPFHRITSRPGAGWSPIPPPVHVCRRVQQSGRSGFRTPTAGNAKRPLLCRVSSESHRSETDRPDKGIRHVCLSLPMSICSAKRAEQNRTAQSTISEEQYSKMFRNLRTSAPFCLTCPTDPEPQSPAKHSIITFGRESK